MAGSWQDSLQAFLNNNPDLPQGEDVAQEPEQASKPKQPRLDIILDKKGRAGKMATIISGFVIDDEEINQLARKLKTRLGVGGSARGGEILIQGDRRQDVLKFLTEQGFKSRII